MEPTESASQMEVAPIVPGQTLMARVGALMIAKSDRSVSVFARSQQAPFMIEVLTVANTAKVSSEVCVSADSRLVAVRCGGRVVVAFHGVVGAEIELGARRIFAVEDTLLVFTTKSTATGVSVYRSDSGRIDDFPDIDNTAVVLWDKTLIWTTGRKVCMTDITTRATEEQDLQHPGYVHAFYRQIGHLVVAVVTDAGEMRLRRCQVEPGLLIPVDEKVIKTPRIRSLFIGPAFDVWKTDGRMWTHTERGLVSRQKPLAYERMPGVWHTQYVDQAGTIVLLK